jgi:Type VI secretion system/phage-baseplate injector OB domain
MAGHSEVLLENLMLHGLEHFRKFYGLYRATVTDNKDPQQRGRIQAVVPEVGHQSGQAPAVWIDPVFDYAGASHGSFWPPEIGDSVRVAYSQGDPSVPAFYIAGWYGSNPAELPTNLGYDGGAPSAPITRGWVTKSGHTLSFNDKAGSEEIKIYWKDQTAYIDFDKDGSITVQNTHGSHVFLDAPGKQIEIKDETGNIITMDSSSKINIQDTNGNTWLMNSTGVTLTTSAFFCGGSSAVDAMVKGTTYRMAEDIWFTQLATAITVLGAELAATGALFTTASVPLAIPIIGGLIAAPEVLAAGTLLSTIPSGLAVVQSALAAFQGPEATYLSTISKVL